MSARRFVPLAVLVVLTFAAAVAWPRATIAQAPPEVPQLSGPVTDLADSGDAAVPGDGSLSDLEDERGYQLFSLFVDSTQPTPIAQYTEDVARQNGLGAADALLVVAIEDRTYQLWLGDTIAESVTEGEQDGILARSVEPQLRDGDYTGAVSAAANGINSASGSGGGGSAWGWLIPVALIIGLALLAFWFIRRMWTRSRAEPAGGTGQARRRKKPVRELETEANTLLLQLDEGVREAEQELAFSEAAGDGTELAEFQAAIKTAKQHLRRAFELRQALDDQKTGPEEQQRSTLEAVITECEAGRQLLVEQFTRVNERRDYERDAPATLERLSSEVAALEARLPEAERTMTSLRTQAETAWRPVRGNIDEATKRAALARESIARGQALADRDRAAAAREARIAQQALAEGSVLLDAIENLAKQLLEARAGLAGMLAEAEESMLRASQLASSEGRSAPELDEIRARLHEAQEKATADPPDLLTAYQLARHADASADELLVSLRTAGEETRRARAAVDTELAAARASYSRAADFIRGRRGSVGREARTRLAEAHRLLESAEDLRAENPQQALELSRRATRLADDAYRLADDDFGHRQTWGTGTVFGGGGGMIPGILIGGVLGDIIGGGGGRRGGWGGAGRSIGGSIGGVLGGLGGRSRGGRW